MPIENYHGANIAHQQVCPRPGRFLDLENLQRHNYTFDSSSLSPSTDIPGSSESIFNAIRVTSPEGSTLCSGTAYKMGPLMEEGLAANIAMFMPPASSHDGHSSADHPSPREESRQVDTVWWRNQMLSDQTSLHPPHLGAGPFTETILAADAARNLHQKAISLDAVERNQHIPRWPANLGAVSTVRPQYPPPERQPTPPGLPSFNTPEAVYYSAQFLVGQNGGRHSRAVPGDGQQARSYGDSVRRFFGLSPSNEPGPGGLSVTGIGRAEDGTIVQGRFPYRQSGHGITLARQLNDHPFHQSNLPVAENGAEQLRHGTGTEGASTKNPESRSRKRVRLYKPPSIGRLWPFSNAFSGSTPSPPRRQGRPIALLGIQQNSPTQDRSTAAPSTMESHVQGVGLMENGTSPISFPLQSAHIPYIPGDLADEELREVGHKLSDLLAWIHTQFNLWCWGNCNFKRRHSMEPLEVVTTGETYLTARENQHRRQCGFPLWISSLPGFAGLGALLSSQSARS